MENKLVNGLLIALTVICLTTLVVILKPNNTLGTELTKNTNTNSYTDGSDLLQNVQAIAEKMAGVTAGYILQADSQGRMQAIAPTSFSGNLGNSYGAFTATGGIVEQSVSSTFTIGNDADGIASGCLILGDSEGTTSTPVYITATGSTVTATTTKPAVCR